MQQKWRVVDDFEKLGGRFWEQPLFDLFNPFGTIIDISIVPNRKRLIRIFELEEIYESTFITPGWARYGCHCARY
jgi:hypothetical protein